MAGNSNNQCLKVLAFTGVFLPGYKGGGPIKTIKNLFDHAGDDISFRLVTGDRDLGDTMPYTSVFCGEWNRVGSADVFYAQPGTQGYKQIAAIIKKNSYDIIYLNSFFSLRFSFYPLLLAKLLRKKVVLGPRGELSEGALGLKSLKKKLFIAAYKLLRLHLGTVFQASSQFEERDILKIFGSGVNIRIAENISAQEFGEFNHERNPKILRAVFVSRISPMKNLIVALESLRKVLRPMVYHIYGPDEDKSYWKQCQRVIETLPEHIKVEYKGTLSPDNVIETVSRYDVFYLPTRGENYGHAIAEAICAGLPVLIADTTPWRNLQDHRIGWDLPLGNPDAFSKVLNELALMPEQEYLELRQRVLSWAKVKFSQRDAVEANVALFRYAHERK